MQKGEIMHLKKGSCNLEDLIKFVHSIEDFEAFEEIYKPFLKKRVEEEFDEFYFIGEDKPIGTVALVYKFEEKI